MPAATTSPTMLEIVNDGEIDINAILLIGASTKRDDASKIGYFGSGLKYSMATLLRNGIPFTIFSGKKEVKITTKKVTLRGQDFRQVVINGKPTSMTLEMGIDWEPWFAVREILCNAIDEGFFTLQHVQAMKPEAGCTKVYVGMHEALDDMFANWDKYFSDKRQDVEQSAAGCKLLTGGKELIVYRKGIRAHHEKVPCIFNYDMSWAEINESRVLKSLYDFRYNLVNWIARHATVDVVRAVFDGSKEMWEWTMDWNHFGGVWFNENWLSVIAGRPLIMQDVSGHFADEIDTSLVLLNSLCKALKGHFKDKVRVLGQSHGNTGRIILPQDERHRSIIKDVKDFLAKAGINIVYPVEVCKFSSENQLGEADNGTIFLGTKAFDLGKRTVAAAMIEEYAHLESKAPDKSREFQSYLLDQYLGQLEKATGQYL